MLTICWGAKGGSGTSVTAAAIALGSRQDCLLVDLAGELPAVFGIGEPDVPGVLDWMSSDADVNRLDALEIALTEGNTMIHRGTLGTTPATRWRAAANRWSDQSRHVIVDAGTNPSSGVVDVAGARRLLVTRPCFLAVRAASKAPAGIDGIVLVEEPGRALTARDVTEALGAPVVAHLLVDPAVARAVDGGLLVNRLPRGMYRQLRRIAA